MKLAWQKGGRGAVRARVQMRHSYRESAIFIPFGTHICICDRWGMGDLIGRKSARVEAEELKRVPERAAIAALLFRRTIAGSAATPSVCVSASGASTPRETSPQRDAPNAVWINTQTSSGGSSSSAAQLCCTH